MKYAVALGFCLFMGWTGISLGLGAAFPSINSVASPVLCPGGEMAARQHVRHTAPGTTYTSAAWTCTDASGSAPVSNFAIAMCAGSFYGLVMFAVLTVFFALRRPRGAR